MSDPRFEALQSIGGNVMSWMSEKELNDADKAICLCVRCEQPVDEDNLLCEKCQDLTIE